MKYKLILSVLCAILTATGFAETVLAQLYTVRHKNDVHCVAFSPDGKLIATGSLHNERTKKHPGDDKLRELIKKLGGDEKQVEFVTKRGGEIKLWDVAKGQLLTTLRAHNDCVCAVDFSPDGKTLATANAILIGIKGRDSSCEVKLWDLATGKERATLTGHPNSIRSIAFSRDGKRLASVSYDGTVIIWNVAEAKQLLSFHVQSDAIWKLAYFPDGKLLVIGEQKGSVTFWSTETGKKRGDIQGIPGFVGCHSLAISPDGRFLAAGLLPPIDRLEKSIVQVWEIAVIGKRDPLVSTLEKTKFARHTGLVGALAFSPDGRVLASGGSDTTVRIWNPSTGEELAVLKGHTGVIDGVAFSPDGILLATASWDKCVYLWEVDDILKRKER